MQTRNLAISVLEYGVLWNCLPCIGIFVTTHENAIKGSTRNKSRRCDLLISIVDLTYSTDTRHIHIISDPGFMEATFSWYWQQCLSWYCYSKHKNDTEYERLVPICPRHFGHRSDTFSSVGSSVQYKNKMLRINRAVNDYYQWLGKEFFFLQKSEITMEVGGWIQVSHWIFFGKSSQNSSKLVLIFWSSIPCVFCLYIHC